MQDLRELLVLNELTQREHMHTSSQIDKDTHRQTADKYTYRQADTQTNKHTDVHTNTGERQMSLAVFFSPQ